MLRIKVYEPLCLRSGRCHTLTYQIRIETCSQLRTRQVNSVYVFVRRQRKHFYGTNINI